ncbi:extracellular solute-binding protein [Endozoicomonas montiporae]|uniref:Microcin C transport system substrate-binding protein n=1 Tax=Endozoicomonas montiporae CL-33 TaxID=570277 RepID=A0A142BCP0_9GAMM|nr:extracellular solute-binding protein [Endozoicomonas montiporae]AMO56516.1 microcin C transport system substrate-binding protein [Endozoicomonas montiporae CL-33]
MNIVFFLPASLVYGWLLLTALVPNTLQANEKVTRSHAMSMYDEFKYPANFTHFGYTNPDAPKGGTLRKAATGSFDTFNTFAPKGNWAADSYFLYDSLMVRAGDEPYTVYGLIAQSIEYPQDLSWVAYNLHPDARFHDNAPITADDVVYTFETLREKGPPHYRHLYADVSSVKATSRHRVEFRFSRPQSKPLLLRLSQLRVLPKHFWTRPDNNIAIADLNPPLASGPFKIKDFQAGHQVTYERVKHYWAANLPVNKGRHNFDEVRIDYYRDDQIALEAFKQGAYDLRVDGNPKNWVEGYKGKRLDKGEIIQEAVPNSSLGMRAFVFNLRKAKFADRRLRQAISLALDFQWINKHLYYDTYKQAYSLFSNSELAADALPSANEIKLLSPWHKELPEEVFTRVFQPARTDGSGNWRNNQRLALQLLKDAGWVLKDGKLKHRQTNEPMTFEILLSQPEFERFALPFANNLKLLGIHARISTIDTSQYINRLREFDFDMVIHGFYPGISPTTELKSFWGSESAKAHAGKNISGISLPVLDALIEKAIKAENRNELIDIVRALDRVVLWHYATIPQWYLPYWPFIYKKGLKHPKIPPEYASGLDTWWWQSM